MAKRFIVSVTPVLANHGVNLKSFDTEDEAASFIETLDDYEDGRYSIDDMEQEG